MIYQGFMMNKLLSFILLTSMVGYCYSDNTCPIGETSKTEFLLSFNKKCFKNIKNEKDIVYYAQIANLHGLKIEYLNILSFAEVNGSIEEKFLIGKYFFENSQLAMSEERKHYEIAKGITKLSISAKKGLKKAKEYYVKNVCNSEKFQSAKMDEICN